MKPFLKHRLALLLAFVLLASSPLAAQNLALGKNAHASSETQPASNAFDGRSNTRWESNSTDAEYIMVDLGSV
ncbi:MAG: discoidin domain-containing protein, partial [Hymenobacter sp.]